MSVFRKDIQGFTPYNFLFQNNKLEPLLPWFLYFSLGRFLDGNMWQKFPHPSVATFIHAIMVMSLSLCHHHGLHCTSTAQSTVTISPQMYTYHHHFDAVSIYFAPPPLYFSLHHCWCLNIHATSMISIVSFPLPPQPLFQRKWWCIHYTMDHLVYISPYHCCSSNYVVSVFPCPWCVTAIPDISVLQLMYQFSCSVDFFLCLHLWTKRWQVQCWYLVPHIGGNFQYRVSVNFLGRTKAHLIWPLFYWSILSPGGKPSLN